MLEHRIQKREFLSTPSARRATLSLLSMAVSGRAFLSTPSARRATAAHPPLLRIHAISIHALREEGDAPSSSGRSPSLYFYPRPPRGGRHSGREPLIVQAEISIHALREEGDRGQFCRSSAPGMISIHALREEGDDKRHPHPHTWRISIHALREEGDLAYALNGSELTYFYPRPPRGGRPSTQSVVL